MRLDLLYSQTITALRDAGYADSTIGRYRSVYTRMEQFMSDNGVTEYAPEIGADYLPALQALYSWEEGKRLCATVLRHINTVYEGKTIAVPRRKRSPNRINNFPDYEKYLAWCETKTLAPGTLKNYRDITVVITDYLESVDVHSANEIKPKHILGFCETLAKYDKGHKHNILFVLRNSLRYFKDTNIIERDLAEVVPVLKYDHQSKLPSVYTPEEIDMMLKAVDTSTPLGKRNYAMLLLVDSTGMRSSDVVSLTFDNIDWENDRIDIVPHKTGRNHQIFPLFPELGEAIKDYLFNGRPSSDAEYIFVSGEYPHGKISASTFSCIVKKSLNNAGIDTSTRKAGAHAIRHSLATTMLRNGQPITEIAKVLNHSSIQTTTIYAKVDTTSLSHCSLDVPEFRGFNPYDLDERLGVPIVGALAHHIVDYILMQRALGKKAESDEKRLRNLSEFSLDYDLLESLLPERMVLDWCKRHDTEKPNTHRSRIGTLHSFAIYLQNKEFDVYVPEVPVFRNRWSTFTPHIYSDDEIKRFFAAADTMNVDKCNTPYDRKNYFPTLFRLLLGCGLRIGEALKLLPTDVSFERKTIHIRMAKNDKERMVVMSDSLCCQLRTYLDDNAISDTSPIFSRRDGKALSIRVIYEWFRKILRNAGIEHRGKEYGPRIHDFRHTFAVRSLTKMLNEGMPFYSALPILKDYLGHSDITATEKYLHFVEWMYPDFVDKMNDISNQVIPGLEVPK